MKKIKSALIVVLLLVFLITNMQKTFPKFFYKKANMIISETIIIRKDLKDKTIDIKEFPAQTYENFYDLPFDELNYIDEEGYEELKQIYAQIDFKSDFKKGNMDSYDFYINKYKQLVNNEIMFYDAYWDKEQYLDQYGQLKNREHSQYDPDKYTYFFFDIDGDSYLELGVTEYSPVINMKRFIYIFKYEAIADRMVMWYSTESTYSWLMGTQKMGWNQYGTSYGFIQLDTNGDIERRIEFVKDAFYTNGILIYLVSSPWYRDQDNSTFMSKAIKSQGYYTEWGERFYFRVTEEQFEELTQEFMQAENVIEINKKGGTLLQTERELQLRKGLENLEETNDQCTRTERQLDRLEDDILWQNRRNKELNDNLFECYPQDKKLQQILARSEELLGRQVSTENILFCEYRENLREMKKQTGQQMDDYREEIQRIQKEYVKEGEVDENNSNIYNT